MAFSINAIIHSRPDKNGLHKLIIRVIMNRMISYAPTPFKIQQSQLKNNSVVGHPLRNKMNAMIRKQMSEIEEKLLDLIKLRAGEMSLEDLKRAVSGEKTVEAKFTDFIRQHISEMQGGKKSPATIQVYSSIVDELEEFDEYLYFHKINISWLNRYEQHQRAKVEPNTVHKKMKNIKAFLRKAHKQEGLIKPERYEGYTVPVYENPIPEYLDENEIVAFKKVCDSIVQPMMKLSGYYFLLSCYAGYRISDLKKFQYGSAVKNDRLLLKLKKNKSITSIPIHSRLAEILEYCKENQLDISEQNMRDHVKQIAKLAGVSRKIKVHTARHSFAMLLMDNGFDLEEVAELLGVSLKTVRVYARISNKRLEKKIIDKLG